MKRSRIDESGRRTSRFLILAGLLMLLVTACAEESPQAPTTTPITMTMDDMEHMEDGHEHDEAGREWEGAPPVISLRIDEGPNGPTAMLEASGFAFIDPSRDEHVPGFGHTHVFVDGRLFEMSYDAAVPLGDLDPGTHHVEVRLASGDHADFLVGGEVLSASAMIEIAGEIQAADLSIPVGFAGGVVDVADDRFEVTRHGLVEITVTTDITDEVHVHGYNLTHDVEAGTSTTFRFTADIPGVFEIELEESGHPLFELTVTP